MNNQTVPEYLRNTPISIGGNVTQGLGIAAPPSVSIRGNRFTLIDSSGREFPLPTFDPAKGPYLDCVVAHANPNVSKVYYEGPYDPQNAGVPPDCWSDNGVAPSVNANRPQNDLCATCPKGQWGSATSAMTGEQTKACNDVKKLAVIIAPNPAIPAAISEMLFLFRCPPASLRNMRGYMEGITQYVVFDRRMEVTDIITRIYFEVGKQGILTFEPSPLGYIDPASRRMLEVVHSEHKADNMIGLNDKPRQLGLPAPQQHQALPTHPAAPVQQPAFAPAPQPAPQPAPAFGAPMAPQPAPAAAPNGQAPRQRGRPRKDAQQAQPPQMAPGGQPAMPPFAQAPQPPQQAPAFAQPPAPAPQQAPAPAAVPTPPQGFGTAAAAPTPSALNDALSAAFGSPPT